MASCGWSASNSRGGSQWRLRSSCAGSRASSAPRWGSGAGARQAFSGRLPASSCYHRASSPSPEGPLPMLKLLTKIVGDPNAKELKKLQPLVEEINDLEPEMAELNDEQLRDQTAEFKQRLEQGETL